MFHPLSLLIRMAFNCLKPSIVFIISIGAVSTPRGFNLVPNSSFEEIAFSHCGDFGSYRQFEGAIKNWLLPTQATPRIADMDVEPHCYNFVSSSDSLRPHTGQRMVLLAFFSESAYRSYLEIRLEEPLVKGRKYYTEVWVQMNNRALACNNIGLLFSDTLIRVQFDTTSRIRNVPFMGTLRFVPQVNHGQVVSDAYGWICLKASFIADSRYEYLLIGNFFSNDQTITQKNPVLSAVTTGIFYFLDDVYVGDRPGS